MDSAGYAIPYRSPSDEEVENPGHTKLDKTKRELPDDKGSYQKLIKR